MEHTRTIVMQKVWANVYTQTAIFIGLASIAPLFPMQVIAGLIVNALLFMAVIFLGIRHALIICALPSIIALSTGLLPFVLAPIIPFIIVGNIILVSIFNYVKDKNYWIGIISASLLKFIFIFATSLVIVDRFLSAKIASNILHMMSWPQLVNALLGGIIAYAFLKFIKKI